MTLTAKQIKKIRKRVNKMIDNRITPRTVIDHEYMSDGHCGVEHATWCKCVTRVLPIPEQTKNERDLLTLLNHIDSASKTIAALDIGSEESKTYIGKYWIREYAERIVKGEYR